MWTCTMDSYDTGSGEVFYSTTSLTPGSFSYIWCLSFLYPNSVSRKWKIGTLILVQWLRRQQSLKSSYSTFFYRGLSMKWNVTRKLVPALSWHLKLLMTCNDRSERRLHLRSHGDDRTILPTARDWQNKSETGKEGPSTVVSSRTYA